MNIGLMKPIPRCINSPAPHPVGSFWHPSCIPAAAHETSLTFTPSGSSQWRRARLRQALHQRRLTSRWVHGPCELCKRLRSEQMGWGGWAPGLLLPRPDPARPEESASKSTHSASPTVLQAQQMTQLAEFAGAGRQGTRQPFSESLRCAPPFVPSPTGTGLR